MKERKTREEKHPLPLSSWPRRPHIFRNWTLGQISYFRVKLSTSVTDLLRLPDTSRRLLDSPALLCCTKVWRGVSIGMNDHTYCTLPRGPVLQNSPFLFVSLFLYVCVHLSLTQKLCFYREEAIFSQARPDASITIARSSPCREISSEARAFPFVLLGFSKRSV